MRNFRLATKLLFVFTLLTLVAACTTAPGDRSGIMAAPVIQKLPPVPTPEPLKSLPQTDATSSHNNSNADDIANGVVVAISPSGEDIHRPLEGAEGCCGTGCLKACVTE